MKITKLGHSCLAIEKDGTKIVIDPGNYTNPDADLNNIDALFFTHGQHRDHLDIDVVKSILESNPNLPVYSDGETAQILQQEKIQTKVAKAGDEIMVKEMSIKVFGLEHERIYPDTSTGGNICFLADNKFFDPGDSFIVPGVPIEVLALPVSAPWLKLSESIDYALKIKPEKCLPIHDGNMHATKPVYGAPEKILGENGIEFIKETTLLI